MTFSVSPLIDTDFSLASICYFVSWWSSVVSRGSAWTGKIYDVRPSAVANPSAEGAACFQQAICSRVSHASSSRVWQHFLPSLQSYLGSFSSFTVNISHQPPFEVSATRYAIKGVLHLYLMSLPAKGISLRRQCGGGEKKKERVRGCETRLIRSGGTWRDKLRAVLLFESDKWRQKTSLWGAYRSRMCPGTEGGALPRDVVRGQISAYAWNTSKMSLTPVLKCGFEGSRRESVLGWEAVFSQLPSVVLVVVGGASSFPHVHWKSARGGGATIELCTRQSCSPKALPVAKGKNTCSAWTINSGLMRMMIVLGIENLQLRNITDTKTMGVIQFVASCLQK